MNLESSLIAWIQKKSGRLSSSVKLGIGDDGAVVKSFGDLIFTKDSLVEGTHFRWGYQTLFQLGRKALAVNLSDIAAMGGSPLYALVELGIPQNFSQKKIKEIYRGLFSEAKKEATSIIGGNIVQSSNFWISITLIGKSVGHFVTRSGARPHDLIGVAGYLGLASAGLDSIRHGFKGYKILKTAYQSPCALVGVGSVLAKKHWVHAMIDVSDGFLKDLNHVCCQSKLGAQIEITRLSIHPQLSLWAKQKKSSILHALLTGGEDYALLFTLPLKHEKNIRKLLKNNCILFNIVGEIIPKKGLFLTQKGKPFLLPKRLGYDHFASRASLKKTKNHGNLYTSL